MSRSCVASHVPTSPVVPIGFLVLCFPFIPPALPLFSFLSLSCPFQLCRLPISSPHFLHFLAFPLCSPVFPAKKHCFFQHFRKEDVQKHRAFPDFRQKEAGSPSQQKSRQGESSLGPLFCDTGSPKTTFNGMSSKIAAPHVSRGDGLIKIVFGEWGPLKTPHSFVPFRRGYFGESET